MPDPVGAAATTAAAQNNTSGGSDPASDNGAAQAGVNDADPTSGGKGGAPPSETKNTDPVDYGKVKLPDDAVLKADWMEKTVAHARERGFSAEQAQELLDREIAAAKHLSDQQDGARKAIVEGWPNDARNDAEIGGAAFDETIRLGKRTIARFGTDELRQELDESGLGNHPEFLRFCCRIGKDLSDDKTILGGAPPSTADKKSTAEVLYPSMRKQE